MDMRITCALLFASIASVTSLECWSCIADDCHLDPSNNYKATKVQCTTEKESCQKVEYFGRDSPSKTDYASIVRSCSQGECIPHADNCSDTLKTNPGCMIRHCCNTYNLCNQAAHINTQTGVTILCVVISVLYMPILYRMKNN